MAATKIRGNTQVLPTTITDAEVATAAAIATSKLADGANFIKRDGSVAFTGDVSLGGFRLINLPTTPTADSSVRVCTDERRGAETADRPSDHFTAPTA